MKLCWALIVDLTNLMSTRLSSIERVQTELQFNTEVGCFGTCG
jgi:hypothetical protein